MSSFEINFPEVKLRRKISKNQLSVIFEPNIQKQIEYFFRNHRKILNYVFGRNNSLTFILPILEGFR
jgi:hypothetical protein